MSYGENIVRLAKKQEGTGPIVAGKFQLYDDSVGLATIGYGHCVARKGISQRAANVILEDDLIDAENAVERLSVGDIGEVRRAALVLMCFNLGEAGLGKFTKMLSALRRGDWLEASNQAISSKWSKDVDPRQRVGEGRDDEIALMLLTNEWPEG